jgi:type III pantothenate kinase
MFTARATLPRADSLLAIDVGNSRIKLAVWSEDGLQGVRSVETADENAWGDVLADAWRGASGRRAVVMGSVVPAADARFEQVAQGVTGTQILRVRRDVPLPLPLDVESERDVGVDRVCSAAAAHERLGQACAVASFGTAITIDFVSSDGQFQGGAILPGLDTSCAALASATAALPRVQPAPPRNVCGKNTHEAILSGVVLGAVGAMREIVERYATETCRWPTLVITGGHAALIKDHADFIDAVVPDLCLIGVALAFRRASDAP